MSQPVAASRQPQEPQQSYRAPLMASYRAPQGEASTLESAAAAEAPSQVAASQPGFFGRILACLRTFLDAICCCFPRRASQAASAPLPFTLAEKVAKGNAIIDLHLLENPGQAPDDRIAVFKMHYQNTVVTLMRKVDDGPTPIDAYAKLGLGELLSRFEGSDGTLSITTFFFKLTPDHRAMSYSSSGSSVLFSRNPSRDSHSTGSNHNLTPAEFSSLLNTMHLDAYNRARLIALLRE